MEPTDLFVLGCFLVCGLFIVVFVLTDIETQEVAATQTFIASA